jgi:hypothetical protein
MKGFSDLSLCSGQGEWHGEERPQKDIPPEGEGQGKMPAPSGPRVRQGIVVRFETAAALQSSNPATGFAVFATGLRRATRPSGYG